MISIREVMNECRMFLCIFNICLPNNNMKKINKYKQTEETQKWTLSDVLKIESGRRSKSETWIWVSLTMNQRIPNSLFVEWNICCSVFVPLPCHLSFVCYHKWYNKARRQSRLRILGTIVCLMDLDILFLHFQRIWSIWLSPFYLSTLSSWLLHRLAYIY